MLDQVVLFTFAFFLAYVVLFYARPDFVMVRARDGPVLSTRHLLAYSAMFGAACVFVHVLQAKKRHRAKDMRVGFRFYY